MNVFEEKIEVNIALVIILIFIAVSWLGVFQKIESWFSHGKWVTVQINSSTCLEGSGEDSNVYDCDRVNFYSIETNKIIRGKCVAACEYQVSLLSPSVRYRIEVTNFPIIGKRILNVEKYNY